MNCPIFILNRRALDQSLNMSCGYPVVLPVSFLHQLSSFCISLIFMHGEAASHEFLYGTTGMLDEVVKSCTWAGGFGFNQMFEGANEIVVVDRIPTEDRHAWLR